MGIDVVTLALAKGYTDEKIRDAAFGDIPLDTTLTKKGQAADAATVGDRLQSLSERILGCVIAPTTATVGQVITVKVVDENGKPAAWEAVDFPEQVQPDWNQSDNTIPDYIKNKPKIAIDEDIMDLLSELEMVNPVTISDGSILTSATGEIYSL